MLRVWNNGVAFTAMCVLAALWTVEGASVSTAQDGGSQNVAMPMVLTYQAKVTLRTDARGLQLVTPDVTEHKIQVSLMENKFAISGSVTSCMGAGVIVGPPEKRLRIYDFNQKLVQIFNADEKNITEAELHAIVMFRANEFTHRRALLAALDAGNLPREGLGGPTTEFTLSTMMGLPKTRIRLVTRNTSGKWQLAEYQGKPVVAYLFSDNPVPLPLRKSFLRFLSYELPLSPHARELLVVGNKVPERISIRYMSDAGETELLLRLESVESKVLPEHLGDHENFTKTSSAYAVELAGIDINGIDRWERPGVEELKRKASEEMQDALTRNMPLDAALVPFEYLEQTGDELYLKKLFADLKAAGKEDELSRQFLENGEQSSESMIALRNAAEKRGCGKLYVLDYLIGERLLQEGDSVRAEGFLRSALKGNRLLVGPYVDLGRIAIDRFETVVAWDLFDAAREICPGHPWLNEFSDLERTLEKDFPDFF